MKAIKKFILLTMSIAMVTGCDVGDKEELSTEATYAQEAFGNIESLTEKLSLNIGSLSGSTHGFNNYLIEKLGGFDYVNLDGEIINYG
ncbi:MAG: hypothetical protein ATN32_00150 [Candidatus Epulonipiscium fishelsonii]|nr:MAG: hypothetical protein ATN32_00150 [Epulopiscium sp. AS2M-Bin002]